ncbi:hypothetical protein V8D89_002580 [Ganoderma adspersum]
MSLPTQTPLFHFVVAVFSLLFGAWGTVAEGVPRLTPGRVTSGVPFAHSRPGPLSYSPSAGTKKPISSSGLSSVSSPLGCSEGTIPSFRFPPKVARDVAVRRSASDDPSENFGGVAAGGPYESGLLSVFNRRADSTAGNLTSSNLAVYSVGDLRYAVEISLGGRNYTVQLDTGSSDLWLYTAGLPVQLTNSTGLVASEAYGDVQVQGNIEYAELKIGNFTIKSQVFLNSTTVPEGFDSTRFDGMMGMAFDVGAIYGTVQQAWGMDAADRLALSPLNALFAQSPSSPHNFDILLFRQPELDSVGKGVLIISAHAEGFDSPANPPQLPRVGSENWNIVMDSMKINGQVFSFNSSVVPGVPSGSTVAALDSGSSFPSLPPAAVNAIYGSIPGALYDETSQDWFVPCNSSMNLTFVFGFNYADWTPSNNTTGTPFVQMVSTTNTTSMWDEFWTTRATTLSYLPLALDPSSIAHYSTGSAATTPSTTPTEARLSQDLSGSTTSGDTTSSNDDAVSWVNQYGKVVLGLLVASFILNVVLLATVLLEMYRGRRARSSRYAQIRQNDHMEEYGRGPLMQPATETREAR